MHLGIDIPAPIFEIGLKAYLYAEDALRLAKEADRAANDFGVTVVLNPQSVDIFRLSQAVEHVLIFAQHVDAISIGRGAGTVLPEAAKAAGAKGTLLNHAEKPLPLATLARTIDRAREVGLATMVCADSVPEVVAIANLGPDVILAEPPDLIGGNSSVAEVMADFVRDAVREAARVNPKIKLMCSAGIRTPEDAASVIRLGAHATGSTSGILLADDPVAQMRAMIQAVRRAWDEKQQDPAQGATR